MPNENDKQTSPEQESKKTLQMLLDLDPFLKGAFGKAKQLGEQHFEEAVNQIGPDKATQELKNMIAGKLNSNPSFEPAQGIFSPAKVTPEGNIQEGGAMSWIGRGSTGDLLKKMLVMSEIQKKQGNILTPEQQIATLTRTQEMLDKLGIKAKIDVTATGTPSLSAQPELGLSDLQPDQQVQAVALARKIAGVRGADRLIPSIVEGFKQGKTADKIEDELRLSGQSTEFTGPLRSAAQQIMAGKSTTEKQSTFDDLDDLKGDPEQQRDYLKRMALKNSSADQQNLMTGKERTVDFLEEIRGDLKTLEKNGMPTGFFSGNIENLMAKVGQVKNPEMRKVATKIATAVMQYRRSMTGVQFGMIENKEYKNIFPAINKVGNFNTATIDALTGTFKGDLKKFYSLSMGKKNYANLFGDFDTEEEAMASGTKGIVTIAGRKARID